jgi:hypothetical protein
MSDQQPTSLEEMSDRLKRVGTLELLCDKIIAGDMLTEVALEWGVTLSRLRRWIAAEPTRAAAVVAARRISAATYDEKAEKAIKDAKDDLELKRAKELAHHYRWKASKMDPGQYGEKLEVGAPGDFSKTTDDELIGKLDALIPGAAAFAQRVLAGGGGESVH